ncbi:MAG: tRNA lysidine(34) synthetase TilS [Deltaproteobacteria bacterium]|nr:tRNA lysidine(34) synthetase TilS [Deltaproteobacteria bacterium]
MIKKVRETIRRYRMCDAGETVAVAVSGGVDSVVLLHALMEAAKVLPLKLVVCHLNHNLRGRESERDLAFVRELSKRLGLRFVGARLKAGELSGRKGASLQALARTKRYEFLENSAKRHGAGKIALGHTLDDQAETVVMRLIKGSSLKGPCAIPPVSGPFIRPLIETSREDIEGFAADNGIEYVLDSSNSSDKYLRNDIRHNLMPLLKREYNPNVAATLSRVATALRLDEEYMDASARVGLEKALVSTGRGPVVIDCAALLRLHPALINRAFLIAARSLGSDAEAGFTSVHLDSFRALVSGDRPNASIDLPGGLRALREYGRVIITASGKKNPRRFLRTLKVPGTTVIRDAGYSFIAEVVEKAPRNLEEGPWSACFDYGAVVEAGGVKIRRMEPGDRMAPMGMKGRKKLKDIFIDAKVPRERRASTPVFVAGREIIWVVGLRRSELFKVGGDTKLVLKIGCLKRPE